MLVLLGSAGCGRHAVNPSAQSSPSPAGPISSELPPGVCAPTYQQLDEPNATRIEAKLVTRETLLKSDPDMGPGWQTATNYFWLIAEVGSFPAGDIHPVLGAPFSPKPFGYVLAYLQANVDPTDPESVARPCRAIGAQAGPGPAWPLWFDQMKGLADVKVR